MVNNLSKKIGRIKQIMEINDSNLNEVSDEGYRLIKERYSESKLVMTNKDSIDVYVKEQEHGFKPKGIWYGIGTSWIDWVRTEMPEWEDEHVFKLDVNESEMLMIHTLEDLYSFTNKYGGSDRLINWNLVANEYGGIEISPYMWRARMDRRTWWYYPWDVASGCIWNKETITNIEKIV